MRAAGLVTVATLAVLLAASACTKPRPPEPSPAAAPQIQSPAPAPKNPDLSVVMERFYQQVEGGHWPFAYAMLSPRYRERLTQQQLAGRYGDIVDPNVRARQLSDRTVVAWLDGTDRANPGRALHVRERVTLVWDGEQWTIDAIERSGVSPGGTR